MIVPLPSRTSCRIMVRKKGGRLIRIETSERMTENANRCIVRIISSTYIGMRSDIDIRRHRRDNRNLFLYPAGTLERSD